MSSELSAPLLPNACDPNHLDRRPTALIEPEMDDAAIAKVSTLMIDNPSEMSEDSSFQLSSDASLRYIQGIVQGQRAWIMTNLLGEETETLLQSQMVWTIGRNRGAGLVLRDRALSRRHAVLLYLPQEGFHLVDLNSMNGTFVNGVRIQQRQLLQDGDRIRLGSTDFTFFVSQCVRIVEPIHPEVLERLTTSNSRPGEFIDYAALEEPEILFRFHGA